MTRYFPGLTKESFRRYIEARRRFNEWEEANPMRLEPAEAVAAAAFLYELMPPESRERPVDPSGVMAMHRALAVLRG